MDSPSYNKKNSNPESPTFYTNANKSEKSLYKSEDVRKVAKSPYKSVPKSGIRFQDFFNIVIESQYAESFVLQRETAMLI